MYVEKIIKGLLIGSGFVNSILFNYNINNVDIIRKENIKTKLLISERLWYSAWAWWIGPFKIPIYLDYIHIKLLNENPENFGYKLFPKNKIHDYEIFKNL